MDKHVFDGVVRELYAAFGKPDPRPAVLDAAFKAVAGLPGGDRKAPGTGRGAHSPTPTKQGAYRSQKGGHKGAKPPQSS